MKKTAFDSLYKNDMFVLLFIFYIIITFSIFSNICLFAFVVFLPSMDISILMADNRGEDNGCEKPYHCALLNLVRFFDVNVKNKKYCNKVRCLKLFFYLCSNFNTYLKQLTYDSINAYMGLCGFF